MPYILLGEPCFNIYASELTKYDFTPVPLSADKRIAPPVNTHADTLIYTDGRNRIINRDYIKKLPPELFGSFILTEDSPSGKYPTDAAFNTLRIGQYLFARAKSLSDAVRKNAKENGLALVNVNQGYAKCSTLALPSANAAVTADEGMARTMESCGIRVLRITPGHIALAGCEYGFIGGASFVHRDAVYFFGSLDAHPDSEQISRFLSDRGYRTVELSGILTDFGGAVVL